jgi:4-hydroxybenzoyl-CoA thioesterase
MGDVVTFSVLIAAIGRASIELNIFGYLNGELALAMSLVMVTTSTATRQPIPLPTDLHTAVKIYREACQR